MASIVELNWSNSQELLIDVDLDALYLRQLRTMGGQIHAKYPYLLLIHTGKILIGIDLGHCRFMQRDFGAGVGADGRVPDDSLWDGLLSRETWE
jgi:hypothetical protein